MKVNKSVSCRLIQFLLVSLVVFSTLMGYSQTADTVNFTSKSDTVKRMVADTVTVIYLSADSAELKARPDTIFVLPQSKDTVQRQVIPDTTIRSMSSDPDSNEHKIIVNKKVYTPDIVFLKNGDRITGKILSFEQGRLCIDGQGPGVVYIKWHKIATVSGGSRVFKVEDVNGVIYYGQIAFSPDTGEVEVIADFKYGIMLENIIRIFPLESEWYRGFKGNVGAGLSYTKSSDVFQVNADYDLYYIIKKWRIMNDFSFISTSTSSANASIRTQVNFQGLYALHKKWVLSEINSFNRNDELGISSRFSIGIGGGNSVVQTDRQRLLVLTGIIQNFERDIESNKAVGNLEWPLTLQHSIYSFVKPNLTSTTSIAAFVGLTEKGRYRLDASTDLTWEFITNLNLKLTFYYNYDNKLVEGKLSKKDYGTIISLELKLK